MASHHYYPNNLPQWLQGVLNCDLTEVTETHILYSFSQNYTYLDYEFIWEAALCHIKILHSSTVPSYPNGDTLNRPDMVRSAPSLLLLTQNIMFTFFLFVFAFEVLAHRWALQMKEIIKYFTQLLLFIIDSSVILIMQYTLFSFCISL